MSNFQINSPVKASNERIQPSPVFYWDEKQNAKPAISFVDTKTPEQQCHQFPKTFLS